MGGTDCIVEVTDLSKAFPGDGGEAWTHACKQLLRKGFSKFGVVVDVRIPTSVAIVRFSSSNASEAVTRAASRGVMKWEDGEIRIRLPSALEAVWRKFPPVKSDNKRPTTTVTSDASNASGVPHAAKKKMRPNERFASTACSPEALDESELFWEAQKDIRGKPGVAQAFEADPQPPVEAVQPPEKPEPSIVGQDASPEEIETCRGQNEVAKEMQQILELPFSKQRKALKALRLRWHPDKRPGCQDVATRVFQFIQAHDDWLAHHGLK